MGHYHVNYYKNSTLSSVRTGRTRQEAIAKARAWKQELVAAGCKVSGSIWHDAYAILCPD